MPRPTDHDLAEALLLDHAPSGDETGPIAVLGIGLQRCETVSRLNQRFGSDAVVAVNLDAGSGVAKCDLPNQQLFVTEIGELDRRFELVLVNCGAPKNYDLLREILRQTDRFLAPDGNLLVAGPKKGGALVAERLLRERYERVTLLEYRKGHRVFRASRPRHQAEEPSVGPEERVFQLIIRGHELAILSDSRVFAKGTLDPATEMLANVFQVPPRSTVLDLGCGTGILGILAAKIEPTSRCYLVDSDPLAVQLARRNVVLNQLDNATVYLSDVLANVPDLRFDVVVMNPPFHRGRATDVSIARRFVEESARALAPGGSIYVVCNSFLPYEPILQASVGDVALVADDRNFKVLRAQRARPHRSHEGLKRQNAARSSGGDTTPNSTKG